MALNNGHVGAADTRELRAVRAARVRAARAFAGIDQQTVADHFGVSKVTVKRMERGERETSLDELAELARLCHVPLGFMINGFAEDDVQGESVALAAGMLLRDEVAQAFQRFDTVSGALLSDAQAAEAATTALRRLVGDRAN
jgi:transcriptional regulator with XRE-family HTH domain